MEIRETSGPFTDLFDFCRRTDKRIVNKRTIESLIRGGAFDALDPNRARLIANIGLCMDAAEQEAANAKKGEGDAGVAGDVPQAGTTEAMRGEMPVGGSKDRVFACHVLADMSGLSPARFLSGLRRAN